MSEKQMTNTENDSHLSAEDKKGIISWMARNSVASNLLMFSLILGGLFFSGKIKKEVFPEFTIDIVNITCCNLNFMKTLLLKLST